MAHRARGLGPGGARADQEVLLLECSWRAAGAFSRATSRASAPRPPASRPGPSTHRTPPPARAPQPRKRAGCGSSPRPITRSEEPTEVREDRPLVGRRCAVADVAVGPDDVCALGARAEAAVEIPPGSRSTVCDAATAAGRSRAGTTMIASTLCGWPARTAVAMRTRFSYPSAVALDPSKRSSSCRALRSNPKKRRFSCGGPNDRSGACCPASGAPPNSFHCARLGRSERGSSVTSAKRTEARSRVTMPLSGSWTRSSLVTSASPRGDGPKRSSLTASVSRRSRRTGLVSWLIRVARSLSRSVRRPTACRSAWCARLLQRVVAEVARHDVDAVAALRHAFQADLALHDDALAR